MARATFPALGENVAKERKVQFFVKIVGFHKFNEIQLILVKITKSNPFSLQSRHFDSVTGVKHQKIMKSVRLMNFRKMKESLNLIKS